MATAELTKSETSQPPAQKQKAELTPFQKKLVGMRDFLQRQSPQMAMVLQKFMTADEVTRFALNAMYRNPKLLECSPESVGMALMKAGQMGIRPDGYHGHLIPFWNGKAKRTECQFQPDYKGLISLAYRSSKVKSVQTGAVREGDFFEFRQGSESHLHYKKSLGERGDLIAAWAMVQLEDGETFVVLNKCDIDRVKAVSKSAADEDSIWKKWPDAMWQKSAVKALSKIVPLGPDFVDAVQADNDQERGKQTIDVRDFKNITEVPTPEDYVETEENGHSAAPANIPHKVSAETLTQQTGTPMPAANAKPAGKRPAKPAETPPVQTEQQQEAPQQETKRPTQFEKWIGQIAGALSEGQLEFLSEEIANAREIGEINADQSAKLDQAVTARYEQLNG